MLAAGWLAGCTSLELQKTGSATPVFHFTNYFEGHTRASGWFANRFNVPTRHFCGDFIGKREGEEFVLDETLNYTDGVVEKRVWRVSIGAGGEFRATSGALVGEATGIVEGNGLHMNYSTRVKVAEGKEYTLVFDDVMLLQPDGSLHNTTQVKKFGIRLGGVATQYVRHDGSDTCATARQRQASTG